MLYVYLNGETIAREQARVSVLDRGFIFGDAVYEVIPAYDGLPFLWDEHMRRLERSIAAIGLCNPYPANQWLDIVQRLIARNGGGDQSVYVQVTRGVAEREHALSEPIEPTVLVMSRPLIAHAAEPVAAVTDTDTRWQMCDVKATALLANVLLRQRAAARGAYEAILIRDGFVTEGAASNVFVVNDGLVRTPPCSHRILPGVTRALVLELLRTHAVPCVEQEIAAPDLQRADEIWLTSSTREILPVATLDGQAVGPVCPGSLWTRVVALYAGYKGQCSGAVARDAARGTAGSGSA